MKRHPYINTIWSDRDQEFWWDGMKIGAITSMVMTSILWGYGIMFVDMIKKKKHEEE